MKTYYRIMTQKLNSFLALVYRAKNHSLESYRAAVRRGKSGNVKRFKPTVRSNHRLPMEPPTTNTGIYTVSKFGARFNLSKYLPQYPPHILEPLSLGKGSLAWSSTRTAWHHLADVAERHNWPLTFPVPIHLILALVTYLFRIRVLVPTTVASYISSIRNWEHLQGIENKNWDNPLIRQIMKGYKNLYLTRLRNPRVRCVITWSILRLLKDEIWKLDFSALDKQVAWCAAILAFWGSLRMGELLQGKLGFDALRCLSWEKLVICDNNTHVIIYVALPKVTDDSQPSDHIDIFDFPIKEYCPIHNILKLHNMNSLLRPPGTFNIDTSVFILSNGEPLTMNGMAQLLKQTLNPLFPGLGNFSPHSFRAGLPSLMGAFPALFTREQLLQHGRWVSKACDLYARTNNEGLRRTHDQLVKAILNAR
jgi:hypothetical protein